MYRPVFKFLTINLVLNFFYGRVFFYGVVLTMRLNG
jgi:hypothetical protein